MSQDVDREIEAGAGRVLHFRPHTPADLQVIAGLWAADRDLRSCLQPAGGLVNFRHQNAENARLMAEAVCPPNLSENEEILTRLQYIQVTQVQPFRYDPFRARSGFPTSPDRSEAE